MSWVKSLQFCHVLPPPLLGLKWDENDEKMTDKDRNIVGRGLENYGNMMVKWAAIVLRHFHGKSLFYTSFHDGKMMGNRYKWAVKLLNSSCNKLVIHHE